MSPFFASLALVVMFALPTFLLLLGVCHAGIALATFVREVRTTDRPIDVTVQP